jgi:hypothetical protein
VDALLEPPCPAPADAVDEVVVCAEAEEEPEAGCPEPDDPDPVADVPVVEVCVCAPDVPDPVWPVVVDPDGVVDGLDVLDVVAEWPDDD